MLWALHNLPCSFQDLCWGGLTFEGARPHVITFEDIKDDNYVTQAGLIKEPQQPLLSSGPPEHNHSTIKLLNSLYVFKTVRLWGQRENREDMVPGQLGKTIIFNQQLQ